MRRLGTRAWIARHLLTVILVSAFLALGWWQISRAADGNTLSWAYAVEWPIFAGFVIFIWLREARQALRGDDAPGPPLATPPTTPGVRRPVRSTRVPVPPQGDDDAELTAYNDYLSWLTANPGARPADYPG
jgi:hypothetical protein